MMEEEADEAQAHLVEEPELEGQAHSSKGDEGTQRPGRAQLGEAPAEAQRAHHL